MRIRVSYSSAGGRGSRGERELGCATASEREGGGETERMGTRAYTAPWREAGREGERDVALKRTLTHLSDSPAQIITYSCLNRLSIPF